MKRNEKRTSAADRREAGSSDNLAAVVAEADVAGIADAVAGVVAVAYFWAACRPVAAAWAERSVSGTPGLQQYFKVQA